MTSEGDDSHSLASKCLDFCQTLASQGQAFTFSLSIGSTFNFSMSTGTQDTPAPAAETVKNKKSPSKKRCKAKERIPEKEIPNPSVNTCQSSRRLH